MDFISLGLSEPILKALSNKGYKTATPIQSKAIPVVLEGRDILGSAQTGTGKTAAFALPIIERLLRKDHWDRHISTLILTPTRELAIQIDENISYYAKNTQLKNAVIFGGVKQQSQVQKINKGIDILVATPGRLLDLINQGLLRIDKIETLVLDEADRMLDMGFIHDIKKILKIVPQKRQTLFFSATMPPNIVKLTKEILYKPTRIEVAPTSSTAETIEQWIYYTNRTSKKDLLFHILSDQSLDQVLVFSRTKHGADRIARTLAKRRIATKAIHGNKTQNQRQKALSEFKDNKIRVLVATDIAARGIDINELHYVINYDIPNLPETYVHRIGRSGRAEKEGIAISICEPEENSYVKAIEKLINKKIKEVQPNPFPQTEKPMTEAEKKEWNKEKQRRKQEFFKNRKKNNSRRYR